MEIIAKKEGIMNMGDYVAKKTIIVFKYVNNPYYYFKYLNDNSHECSKNISEVMQIFNKHSKYIK